MDLPERVLRIRGSLEAGKSLPYLSHETNHLPLTLRPNVYWILFFSVGPRLRSPPLGSSWVWGGSWVLSKMDSAPLPSMVHIGSFRARSLNCARCELGLCRLSPGGHRSNLGATRSFNPPGLGVCAENRRHSICLESAKFEFNFVFYGLLSRETMEHLLLITFIRRF